MSLKKILTTKRATFLISNLIITKMMFTFPRFLFKNSDNAAWIQSIYMSLLAYILFSASSFLVCRAGKFSVLQLAEKVGKKPLKILVSMTVCAVILSGVSSEIRTFAESVKIVLLPKSDLSAIMVLFTASIAFGALAGLSSVTIFNAVFFPLFLLSVLALFISLIPSYEINNIFPIFGTGIKKIFSDGLKEMYCFSDIIALNLLIPYCDNIKTVIRSGKRAIIISGIVLTLICLSYGLTYPYPYSSEFLLIPYQLSRMVRAGEYFQRFEALFEFIWTILHLLYSCAYLVILCGVFADTFDLKSYKPLIFCTACGVSLLAFVPQSVVGFLDKAFIIRQYLALPALLLPIFLPVIYLISEKFGVKNENL